MGFFDPSPSIIDTLVRLVRSPRVQYFGNQIARTAQTQGPQPFRLPNNYRITGASPKPSWNAGAAGQSVGSALGNLAGLFSGAQPQQQPADPLMQLYAQLIDQLRQPVNMPTGIDTADLMRQVRAAIDPIYNQREATARTQTGRATKDVQSMYGQLANEYEKLAPQQVAQANEAKKQVEQLYGQLRSNIEGSYSRVSEEQSDLFKSLGIEAALPDVLADQAPAEEEALTAASENQAQQQQRYMDMGQADATYYREGAPQAIMQGNELSVDMLNRLQDYINQAEAERSSGIQTGYLDQLGQAQTRLGQQQQAAQSEAARRQGMLWDMLQSQMQGKQQQALTPDTFMQQLPPNIQQSVAGAFTRLQRSPEAVYGKVEDKRSPVPGTFTTTTPEWYLAQADRMLQNGEIDPTTHQALLMYIQLNFKMGQ
ncbi:MAG: hypothetical protein HMLIMOIP_002107 [Candidatus Nitrosomirales archaeon]|jgi:hypothetical protein